MDIKKGKIDFLKMPIEKKRFVLDNAHTFDTAKRRIAEEERDLFHSYIRFVFSKIDENEYEEMWAKFLLFLGVEPAIKGIKFLKRRLHHAMSDHIYESLWAKRTIDPRDYVEICFYKELYKTIKEVMESKNIVCYPNTLVTCDWKEDSILYVYQGRTSCHLQKHEIRSATAVLIGRQDSSIKLNVELCNQCKRFYISYSIYKKYLQSYGILLGKLRFNSESEAINNDFLLSEFSPLRLCGYSVGQNESLSKNERRYIISKIIDKGVLKKSEVVRYLEHFINRNGQRKNNEIALKKWEEDLDFTLNYKMSEQSEYVIKRLEIY